MTQTKTGMQRLKTYLGKRLNFFRWHFLAFSFLPLIFAAIFWGANGSFRIPFIDALFLCYSAMTVTGLTTVNLSTLTGFQQAILFFLMAIGDQTVVSLIVVLTRKRWFQRKLDRMLQNDKLRRSETIASRTAGQPQQKSSRDRRGKDERGRTSTADAEVGEEGEGAKTLRRRTLSARLHISEPSHARQFANFATERHEAGDDSKEPGSSLALSILPSFPQSDVEATTDNSEKTKTFHDSPPSISSIDLPLPAPLSPSADHPPHPSLAFKLPSKPNSHSTDNHIPVSPLQSGSRSQIQASPRSLAHRKLAQHSHHQSTDAYPFSDEHPRAPIAGSSSLHQGMGGFGLPSLVPQQLRRRLTRELPMRRTTTLVSKHDGRGDGEILKVEVKKDREGLAVIAVKWLTFDGLLVGRNSLFKTHNLTDAQLGELGGVEYRALRILGYLVGGYFVLTQLISFILIYPQLVTRSTWDGVFTDQARGVGKAWFSVFQVLSAYTGTGMSLVDLGMVPFSTNYLMVVSLSFIILCGNQALPLLLRLLVWIASKLVRSDSETEEALHFLLAHPRRCFLYLFPSRETWMLLVVLISFTVIEIVGFGVLNINLPVIESIPIGQRIADSVFQSLCVRATGFQIVPIAAVAPSLQFLYILLMYVAVYPVALSIRGTNVYEEQALGVNEAEHRPVVHDETTPKTADDAADEKTAETEETELFSKYLAAHARRQLAFDIWPLAFAIFLICIIERKMIMDDTQAPWFNVFRIVFELVSGYGGIGLSLGIPTENFSFSGSFQPLSKLVVIVIMIRGRHRGLPQAIDRAILLPREFKATYHRQASSPEPNDGEIA